ncbi:MAG TPA: response regulator [Pyrinomonadaceae bacterium]
MSTRQTSRPVEERTILLVDDYDGIRLLMKTYLQKHGYRVLEARDGDEAVRIAGEECQTLRLIFMDLNLPGTDGLAATRSIRQMSGLCEVPIVACTARSSAAEREAARQAGCTDLVAKPLGMAAIETIIERFLPREGVDGRR